MNLFSVLLVSFPEAVLVAVLGFLLTGIRPWWRDLLMIGALQAVLSYIIRLSPVPFGLHSILLMFLFTLNILLVTRLPYRIVLLISLLGLIIYGSVETVTVPLMLHATGHPFNYVMSHPGQVGTVLACLVKYRARAIKCRPFVRQKNLGITAFLGFSASQPSAS